LYAEAQPIAWSTIAEGGWDLIGAPESDGGGGASLRDLAEIAQAWGAGCIPLPLLESLWLKRWSVGARALDGPMSLAVRRPGTDTGLAPFGTYGGITLALTVGRAIDEWASEPSGQADDLAPSLRLLAVPWVTDVPREAARELAVLWAAEAAGGAQRLVDLSVQYAKDRTQFGKPIGSFQAVKHRLADMHSTAQYAESAVIWASLEPDEAGRVSLYALDAAINVAEGSIQVHGGMGFTWEMGLHFYLRSMLSRRELIRGLLA
jgi:alkylation response protein AidB-like acyl-CoA dehydrogenase